MNAIKPPEWMIDGLCAQTDPEVFFPDKGEPNTTAKRVCLACPVRSQCLEYAIEHNEPFGVWGGKSHAERRKLADQREREGRRAA